MSDKYGIITKPVVTEKSHRLMEGRTGTKRKGAPVRLYTFEVNQRANKFQIKKAVEELFKVKVVGVSTSYVRPKRRRVGVHRGYTRSWKKAVVRLAPGQTIELY